MRRYRRPEPIALPREVLDRVNRVHRFHTLTCYTFDSLRAIPAPAPSTRPSPCLEFSDRPAVPLPSSLHDIPTDTLLLLSQGMDVLPDSLMHPPQDLKTLATWLHMADGIVERRESGGVQYGLRSCPSAGALYPYEIYVAAFAVEGLESGLYHYSPRQFSLRKLRDGPETLARIKRGRPDLDFIKNCPAVALVSCAYHRSCWKYQLRGYRLALLDCGHLVQNLVAAGTGLGMQTLSRLRLPELATRELIGLPPEPAFGELESVQAMVAWADAAAKPMPAGAAPPGPLPSIARQPLPLGAPEYPEIASAHWDCVAPGVAIVDVKPKLTELSPLPPGMPAEEAAIEPIISSPSLRRVLLARRSTRHFGRSTMSRDQFVEINRVALRGGTCFPIKPAGPHIGLVRPFWVVNSIAGFEPGVWYYHPPTDRWTWLQPGSFPTEARYLCAEQAIARDAAAVCFLAANLHTLMTQAGPDTYRLAHLEAGMVGQRMYLASGAMGLGCCGIGLFLDEELREFLTLTPTGWYVMYGVALGTAGEASEPFNPL